MIYERRNAPSILDESIHIRIGKKAPEEFTKFAIDFFSKVNHKLPLKTKFGKLFKEYISDKESNFYNFQFDDPKNNLLKAANAAGLGGAFYGPSRIYDAEFRKGIAEEHDAKKQVIRIIESCGLSGRSKNKSSYYSEYRYSYSKNEDYIFIAFPTVIKEGKYYSTFGISLKCVSNNTKNRRTYQIEATLSHPDRPITIITHNSMGKPVIEVATDDSKTPEELYFMNDDPLRDMKDMPELQQYVSYPTAVGEKINEYFDLSDTKTRHAMLNEATANSVLTSLTSKLYDHIVKKTTSINYGTIPDTKGDITKLTMYDELKDVCQIIKGIVTEYGEKGGPIDTVTLAMSNIESRKDLFSRAYRADCELPVMIYENAVLGVVNATSYLIAACIELIKAPSDETYKIQLDKLAYSKSRDHLLYTSLDKFNKACEKGDIDKACNDVINRRVRKFTGAVAASIAAGALIGIVVIMNIIPILRELVYMSYYTRTKISDFFDIQADLLQINAYNVEANTGIDAEQRKEIAKRQKEIADKYRKIANAIQIDSKQSEVKASREIQANSRKYKADDIINKDIEDDTDEGVSSLF